MKRADPARSFTAAQAAAFRLTRHHLADRSAKAFALRKDRPPKDVVLRSAKASAERLVDVVRDTGGIQAQVMSAADLSIWTRRRQTFLGATCSARFRQRAGFITSMEGPTHVSARGRTRGSAPTSKVVNRLYSSVPI
jgi:hypothetical protein